MRRLNQIDYAADSPFAAAIEQSDIGTNRLAYLASLVLRWLDDGTIPAATTTTSVIPAKPVLSKAEGADRVLTLAEFGTSSDTDSKIRTETVYDDDGNIAAQIVYDADGNITVFALYPDDDSKVVITSTYDTDGNLTSQVFTTYDADGNVISREEMPLPTETILATENIENLSTNYELRTTNYELRTTN